jgi:hypothetical protein
LLGVTAEYAGGQQSADQGPSVIPEG